MYCKTDEQFKYIQYAVTICRIEPENNIHCILDCFSRQDKINLIIIGNWKNSKYGNRLFTMYNNHEHINLINSVYDHDRLKFLRSNAFLYIHGHSAGGTNPSLVEAMIFGLPVLAFDCIYNRYTTESQCLYWSSSDALYELITKTNLEDLKNIGMKMKSIADRRYQWKNIVEKYESLYYNFL
jgi:glycosyltransferase involved in cell wall biosynthesis